MDNSTPFSALVKELHDKYISSNLDLKESTLKDATFSDRINFYWNKIGHSFRDADRNAAIAHLYGVASEFQYECIMVRHLDGPDGYGQELCMDVEASCLDILNTLFVSQEQMTALAYRVRSLLMWMKACENEA